jgi:hypothetical protein
MAKTRKQASEKWSAVTMDREQVRKLAEIASVHKTTVPTFLASLVEYLAALDDEQQAEILRGKAVSR